MGTVGLNRLDRDKQFRPDFSICVSDSDQTEDFAFALGKCLKCGLSTCACAPRPLHKVGEQTLLHRRRNTCMSPRNISDRSQNHLRFGAFQDVSCATSLDSLKQVRFAGMHCQDQHRNTRKFSSDSPQCFQTIEVWHGDIHDHDIHSTSSAEATEAIEGTLPIGSLADNDKVRLVFDQLPDPCPEDYVVVCEKNPYG